MQKNFKIILKYNGTNYHGWQIQPGVATIQQVLEESLQRLLGGKIRAYASGRTDTGVHAEAQVVHFKTEKEISPQELEKSLNKILPGDIEVLSIEEVAENFHARYAVRSKQYRYTVLNSKPPYPPEKRAKNVYYFRQELDVERMREAASHLLGKHDFSAFGVNPGWKVENPVKTMMKIEIIRQGSYIYFDFEADGFLYKMVRSIVGTLLKVGVGRISPDAMPQLLQSRDRRNAGPTVPASGLCLIKVNY